MLSMKTYEVKFSPDRDVGAGVLLDDFTFPWREESCPKTEFRAVWDGDVLRFRFDVEDTDLVLHEGEDADASVLGSDRVELFFASVADLSEPYFGAEMDPRGQVFDYRAIHYRRIDSAWSFPDLRLTAEVGETGYAVEGSFGLDGLRRLRCLRGREMIAGVYRAEFSHGAGGIDEDWISWIAPDSETPDFHVPSSFGRFVFID